jgi:hypothetical protein
MGVHCSRLDGGEISLTINNLRIPRGICEVKNYQNGSLETVKQVLTIGVCLLCNLSKASDTYGEMYV